MKGHETLMSRKSDDWGTPTDLFRQLYREFDFEIDAAANAENALLPRWFGPGGQHEDALTAHWPAFGRRFFCNPPYSQLRQFLAKGQEAQRQGCLSVWLIPARTDTRAWQDYVWDSTRWRWRPGVRGNFLRGRLTFQGAVSGAPFPSALIVMEPL